MTRNSEEKDFTKRDVVRKAGLFIWLLMLCGIIPIAFLETIGQTWTLCFFLPVVLFIAGFLFYKNVRLPENFPYTPVWWVICVTAAFLMIWFAYSVRVGNLSWDWGKVIRSASERALTGELQDTIYFARYPNNRFWYCILVVVFKIVLKINPSAQLEEFYLVSIALGCLMVTATIILFHEAAKLLWGVKKAFVAGCAAFLCLPLYLWAMYAYTDTAGMLALMMLLFLFLKAFRCRKTGQYVLCFALFGIVAAAAYMLKVTVFIFVLATVPALLCKRMQMKKLLLGVLLIFCFFGIGKVTIDTGVHHVLPIDEKTYDRYEFPLTHWVMMSLGYGGYRQEDVDFTESFPSYRKKCEANWKEIRKRLNEKGLQGGIKFFFYNKQIRTWGDSTFAGCEYLSREPVYPDGFLERFVTSEGEWNGVLRLWTGLYYCLMLIGMFLSAFFSVRKRGGENELFAGSLTMAGIALFLTIWECNSRYLVVFLPLMILLSCEGYFELSRFLSTWRGVERKTWISRREEAN